MSLKGHYYKVSYCGRDSRFRLFPAQIRMYAANASIPTSGIWRRSGCQKLAAKPQYQPAESLSRLSIPILSLHRMNYALCQKDWHYVASKPQELPSGWIPLRIG